MSQADKWKILLLAMILAVQVLQFLQASQNSVTASGPSGPIDANIVSVAPDVWVKTSIKDIDLATSADTLPVCFPHRFGVLSSCDNQVVVGP